MQTSRVTKAMVLWYRDIVLSKTRLNDVAGSKSARGVLSQNVMQFYRQFYIFRVTDKSWR